MVTFFFIFINATKPSLFNSLNTTEQNSIGRKLMPDKRLRRQSPNSSPQHLHFKLQLLDF